MDDVDYTPTPYKYVSPKDEGMTLHSVRRTWLRNYYRYVKEQDYEPTMWEEARHPNWLAKTLAVVLFPASVIVQGAPEAWYDTRRFIWDRRNGSFSSDRWWTE